MRSVRLVPCPCRVAHDLDRHCACDRQECTVSLLHVSRSDPLHSLTRAAVIAYDILYLKNKKGVARCFLDVALRYRKQSLARVFKEEPGRFELAPWVKGKTTEDVIVELHKIVAERCALARC